MKGVVSINGKPVAHGVIGFYKQGSKAIGGAIGVDGSFSLAIPPGEYQVRVDAPAPLPPGYKEGDPPPKLGPREVPEKFANFSTSGLTATIGSSSPQQLDFLLN